MPLKDTDLQLIDKYFLGQLNPTEKESFETKKKDPEFLSELTWKENSLSVIKKSGRTELKKKLQHLEEKIQKENTLPESTPTVPRKLFSLISMAAAIILMLGIFWWWNSSASNSDQLFAQYFEPYPNVVAPITKGTTETNHCLLYTSDAADE